MSKPIVLFVAPLDHKLPEFKEFSLKFEPIFYRLSTRSKFLSDLKTDPKLSKIAGIYAGFEGFRTIGGLIDDELLDSLPSSVKIVTVCSAGFNGYNMEGLRKRDIDFCNTPNFGALDVADVAIYHMLCGFRWFSPFQNSLYRQKNTIKARMQQQEYTSFNKKTGRFESNNKQKDPWFAFGERAADNLYVSSPAGKVVTIVGFGHIGKHVGQIASSMGMSIRYVGRHEIKDNVGYPILYYSSLINAAYGTDCVVLCAPQTKETIGMVNSQAISKLNDGCCIVNVGRGGLIIEEDLLNGLKSGKIGYAGLDVVADEPFINEELLQREDVGVTPHLGSCTKQNYDRTAAFCLKNITAELENQNVQNIQN